MHQHHPGHNHNQPPSRNIQFGILAILVIAGLVAILAPSFLPTFSKPDSYATDPIEENQESDRYYLADVLSASDIDDMDPTGATVIKQQVKLRFKTGPLKGEERHIENGAILGIYRDQRVHE